MYYGVDVGRGYVKCVNGEVLSFPSYLAPAREMDLISADGDVMSRLVVTINGESWFVGEMARSDGGSREFQKDKALHQNTLPLLVTAIAMATRDDYLSPKVVIGLPIADYRTQARSFEHACLGHYRIILPHKTVNLELAKGQVLCFPEACGAAWDLLLNDKGQLIDTGLTRKTFAVLDIGWRTANFVVLQECAYQDSLSGTLLLGLSSAFRLFYKRISREVDITPALAEQRLVSSGQPELKRLAQEIKDQLAVWWSSSIIDEVYLAGGGGIALAPYLGYHLLREAQTANARGFYKVARSRR